MGLQPGGSGPGHPLPGPGFVLAMLAVAAVAFGAIGWNADVRPAPVSVLASAPLLDDDGGAAMFSLAAMRPGVPVSRCITVSYGGPDGAGPVGLLATDVGGSLTDRLAVTVERGTGGRYADCTGFAGDEVYAGTLRGLADGRAGTGGVPTGWRPATGQSRTFRVTVSVDMPTQPPPGSTARATFVWQVAQPDPAAPTPSPSAEPSAEPSVEPSARPSAEPSASAAPLVSPAPSSSVAAPAPGAPAATVATGAPAPDRAVVPRAERAEKQPTSPRGRLAAVVDTVRRFVNQTGRYAAFPVVMVVALALFLLVQKEVDRRDPKLAIAPVWEDKYVWIPLSPERAP